MFLINTQAISCVSMCTRQTPGHHPLHSYRHLYSKQCEPAVCINGYFYNIYSDILLLTSGNFAPKVSNKPPYWPRDPLSENTIKKFMSAGNKKWNLQGAGGEFPYQYVVQFFQNRNSTSSTSSEPKHRSWSLDLIAWIENLSVWYFAKRLSKQRPEAFNLSWFVHCSFTFSLYPVLPRPAHVPWANVLTPSRNGTSESMAASKAWFLFLTLDAASWASPDMCFIKTCLLEGQVTQTFCLNTNGIYQTNTI